MSSPAPKQARVRVFPFADLQQTQPDSYFATNGPNNGLVEYRGVKWLPLAVITNNPDETVRSDDELSDDAMNYAAHQEMGAVFPPITIYPDKTIRDGRTRHSMWFLAAQVAGIDPAQYLIPCVEVDKPKKLGERLLDALCDNSAGYAPRKMTKEALREVIRKCRLDGMYQKDIRARLIQDSDFAEPIINKIITEVTTNLQRTKREAILQQVRTETMSAADAAKAIGEGWTTQNVRDAVDGKVVGSGGTEGTQAMRKLYSTFQPLSRSLAQNFRVLSDAINRHEIAPERYEEVYSEIGQYVTNIALAYKRAKRNRVTVVTKPTGEFRIIGR